MENDMLRDSQEHIRSIKQIKLQIEHPYDEITDYGQV